MDNSQEFRSIELCAGYAGISLGLKRVIKNFRTVAYVEIEAFANANLVAKMEAGHLDSAPIWTDLKTFNAKPFRNRIHIITGGYPCQPFSHAGKREGKNDPRHLWPHIREIVKTIKPVFCFFENVEGHLSLGFKEVQQSLRSLGYTVEAGIFSAAECGAPQQRKRLFVLAYRNSHGFGGVLRETGQRKNGAELRTDIDRESIGVGGDGPTCGELAKPSSFRSTSRVSGSGQGQKGKTGKLVNESSEELADSGCQRPPVIKIKSARFKQSCWPSRPGQPQYEWEPPRVVVDSKGSGDVRTTRPGCEKAERQGGTLSREPIRSGSGHKKQLGNAPDNNGRARISKEKAGVGPEGIRRRGSSESSERETKPPMGGNSNGCQGGMDYAELCQSCDNRTDELRLLGNGVAPDTAERAFIVLFNKIMDGINATTT